MKRNNGKSLSNSQRRLIRQLIREEFNRTKIIKENLNNIHEKACLYESRAIRSGMTQEKVNMGIMKIINEEANSMNEFSLGSFGDISSSEVGFDMVKRYLAGMVLGYLGLDEQEDKIIFSLLQNIFEAIDYTQISKFFGDSTRCDEMMRVLTEAITETVTEVGGQEIIKYIAQKALPDAISGTLEGIMDSVLGDVAQESLNQPIVELVQGVLQEPMKKYVCGGQLTDVISNAFNSGGGMGGVFDAIGGIFGSAGIPEV